MKKDEIELLLRESTGPSVNRPACPDDATFASFSEGGLGDAKHRGLIEHISVCVFCQERLGALGRARDSDAEASVNDLVMAKAHRLVPVQIPARTNWNRVPRWAAAAAAVLVVGLFLLPDSADSPVVVTGEPAGHSTNRTPFRETRSIKPLSSGPVLTVPRDGMSMVARGGVFSWVGVPDALWYDLRVVSDEGDLVWLERVSNISWTPPPELSFTPGAEYFIRVDAHLTSSKTLQSDYVLFRIEDTP